MKYNEDARVKIPALVHFTRLGYTYLSIKNKESDFDKEINIHIPTFYSSLNVINDEEIRDFLNFLKKHFNKCRRKNFLGGENTKIPQ